jgi:hypothetical protein
LTRISGGFACNVRISNKLLKFGIAITRRLPQTSLFPARLVSILFADAGDDVTRITVPARMALEALERPVLNRARDSRINIEASFNRAG